MFEKSFQRSSNYYNLSGERQWEIDKDLGILDWDGVNLSEEDKQRFHDHYRVKIESKKSNEPKVHTLKTQLPF